jgi:hypothetical protein
MWTRIIPGFVVGLLLFTIGTTLLVWRANKGRTCGERLRFQIKAGAIVLFLSTLLNSLVFGIVTLICGGSPHGGKVEGGRFFVMNHGEYTEVSTAVWDFLSIHEVVTWIAWPPAMVALGIAFAIRWYEGARGLSSVQRLLGDGTGETGQTNQRTEQIKVRRL